MITTNKQPMNNILSLKQSLDNAVWAMSPASFLSLKARFEQIKADMTYTVTNDNDDDDVIPDDQGRVFICVNGELFRGTGLDGDMCDFFGITDLDNLDEQLINARDNQACKTIVLLFDTPGGTAHSYSTALLINSIAQNKTVIGVVPSMCCSAGFELAAQCDELFVSETAWVGFVGTIFTRADYTKANNIDGVSYTFISSSPKKLYLNPDTSMTDEEQEWIESVVMYSYNQFKDVVLSNRQIDEQYLDASIFIGKEAVKFNFADGIINNKDDLLKKLSAN